MKANEIAIVGEAWGEKEEQVGKPFVGTSGWILDNLLNQAGIDRSQCLVTNTFNLRPKGNKINTLFAARTKTQTKLPPYAKGKYLQEKYEPELERLYDELNDFNPNLIITLGAVATWALLGSMGIKPLRGVLAQASGILPSRSLNRPYKVLPTYHPAAVARQWTIRPVTLADLTKAKRLSESPDYERPSRRIWIRPTLEDLAAYEQSEIRGATRIAADIETKQDQITCISFAPSPSSVLVIPFFCEDGSSYWPTLAEELKAWEFVRRWLAESTIIYQNGVFDMTHLWASYGLPTPKGTEDTMLMHHAMQPELEKGLGFLASVYTDEASWKFMLKGGARHD